MSGKVDKLVMIITGTSRGIGEYLARHYLESDYIVIGCSRTDGEIEHPDYHHFKVDIASEHQVLDVIKYARKEFKRISVLINNAAINPAILSAALLPYETIQNAYKVNVFAPMLFCRESIKIMARKKFGRIINIGSMASKHEVPGEALYTSTKSAMIAYTRVVAKEVYNLGITVNVIAPSAIANTELFNQIDSKALFEVLSRNAIHTTGDFKDISNIIDLLLKKESHAITGQVIYLGGA